MTYGFFSSGPAKFDRTSWIQERCEAFWFLGSTTLCRKLTNWMDRTSAEPSFVPKKFHENKVICETNVNLISISVTNCSVFNKNVEEWKMWFLFSIQISIVVLIFPIMHKRTLLDVGKPGNVHVQFTVYSCTIRMLSECLVRTGLWFFWGFPRLQRPTVSADPSNLSQTQTHGASSGRAGSSSTYIT